MNTRARTLRNTLFSSVGLYTEYALGMLTSIVIARHLAPDGYGTYSLVIWLVGMGVATTNSGTASAAIKFIAELRASGQDARIPALLRRAYPSEEKKLLSFPPFEIDTQRNEVRKEGAKVDLTPKEFELTVTLFRNIGRLMSRGHLQETVWGRSGDLATRTVDTHVSQVRKKLDLRPETGYRVVPIYNYGYRLEKITPP